MDLIDFLEGAYQGGRLLYLLKQHDKKVKDRYKRIKSSPKTSAPVAGVFVRDYIQLQKQLAQQRIPSIVREMQQVANKNPIPTAESKQQINSLFSEAKYNYYNLTQNELKEGHEFAKRFSTALGETVTSLQKLRF